MKARGPAWQPKKPAPDEDAALSTVAGWRPCAGSPFRDRMSAVRIPLLIVPDQPPTNY